MNGYQTSIAAFTMFLLSGCAVISSSPNSSTSTNVPTGFSYFLPKTMMKIEASRTAISVDSIAKAAKKAATLNEVAKSTNATLQKAEALRTSTKGAFEKATADPNFDKDAVVALEKDYKKAVVDYFKNKAAASYASERAKNAIAGLKAISNHVGACAKTVTLSRQSVEADSSRLFTATLNHAWTRSDEWTVKSNELGLLESVDVKSEDKIGEVAIATAELVLQLQGLSGLSAGQIAAMDNAGNTAACPTFSASWIFDPSDDAASKTIIDTQVLNSFGWKIEISANKWSAQTVSTEKKGGLYYRRPIPYQFDITDNGNVIKSARVSLPNGGPIAIASMQAGAFVTTTRSTLFHNGMLVTAYAKRPSEAIGILEIPAEIIKGIIGAE